MSNTATPVQCVVCGTPKKEANHWFIVWADWLSFSAIPYDKICLLPENNMKPVCGQACAQKEFETWMNKTRGIVTQKDSELNQGSVAGRPLRA